MNVFVFPIKSLNQITAANAGKRVGCTGKSG
jgi:hypothetical protein